MKCENVPRANYHHHSRSTIQALVVATKLMNLIQEAGRWGEEGENVAKLVFSDPRQVFQESF